MRREDLGVVRKGEQLLMNALVQDCGKLLRCVGCREVGPSYIANKKRVSREDVLRAVRLAEIRHQDADALHGMAGSLQEAKAALPELNLLAVLNRLVGELSPGPGPEIDPRSGTFGEFAMPRHEVGVQMRLDNVFDLPPVARCRIEIDVNIPLGVDDRCHPL